MLKNTTFSENFESILNELSLTVSTKRNIRCRDWKFKILAWLTVSDEH